MGWTKRGYYKRKQCKKTDPRCEANYAMSRPPSGAPGTIKEALGSGGEAQEIEKGEHQSKNGEDEIQRCQERFPYRM